jgi:hypothetical protein
MRESLVFPNLNQIGRATRISTTRCVSCVLSIRRLCPSTHLKNSSEYFALIFMGFTTEKFLHNYFYPPLSEAEILFHMKHLQLKGFKFFGGQLWIKKLNFYGFIIISRETCNSRFYNEGNFKTEYFPKIWTILVNSM